jgi:Cep192 domain 4
VVVGDFNRDGALDLAAGDQGENLVSILLNQTPPPVIVSPRSLAFGNQLVSTTSAAQTLTVTNNGNATASVSIGTTGDFAQTNTCGANLGSKASCSINVTFKPTIVGPLAGTITLADSLPGSPQIVQLTGTGIAPVVMLGGASISFGSQPVGSTSGVQMVSLSNTGTAALTISSIAITGTNSADFSQTNTCGASVAAGANCSISVTFKPTATGSRTASVNITDNASGSPQTISLTGAGTSPVVVLSAPNLNFAGQLLTTASAPQSVTLTNNGTAALTISAIAITGANSSDFSQTNTCPVSPATLAAAASCSISVTFKPTATGNRAAAVTISDDASGSPQPVGLVGMGTDYSIDVATGGSASATVTAGQTANYALQVTPVSGFNGTVTLSCTGAPSEATCTPSLATVTPNGNTASTFSVSVATTAASLIPPHSLPWHRPLFVRLRVRLPLFLVMLLFALHALSKSAPQRKRTLAWASTLVLFILMSISASGCGGGSGRGVHNSGTPKGMSTLTISGTSGGVTHTRTLTLTVN